MKPTAFYVSSYFWDRATDAGIIGQKAAITWTLKPNDFSAAASKACASSVAGLAVSFPDVSMPGRLISLAHCLVSPTGNMPASLPDCPWSLPEYFCSRLVG